jgi:hypothetical protein
MRKDPSVYADCRGFSLMKEANQIVDPRIHCCFPPLFPELSTATRFWFTRVVLGIPSWGKPGG